MLRKLQNLAELEQRWDAECEDVSGGTLLASSMFFCSHHLTENKLAELEMLCFIAGLWDLVVLC